MLLGDVHVQSFRIHTIKSQIRSVLQSYSKITERWILTYGLAVIYFYVLFCEIAPNLVDLAMPPCTLVSCAKNISAKETTKLFLMLRPYQYQTQ